MTKFQKLIDKLNSVTDENVILTEKDLNKLIDGGLNDNAFSSRSYFANDGTHAIYKAWKSCGFYCSKIDRYERYIVLTKVSSSRQKMLSSDILFHCFKKSITPDFNIVVTPFSFAEICRSKNVQQAELKNYLLSQKATFIDFEGKEISFNDFYTLVNSFGGQNQKLSSRMSYTYESFVTYVYATCLVNIGVGVDEIINYYETRPFLPIQYFNDLTNSHSLRVSFNKMCLEIDDSINVLDAINRIKKLDYKEVQTFMTDCSPLELLFYDYSLKYFIEQLNNEDRFVIQPKVVEEMLNSSLLNICKKYIYLTNQPFTSDILLGSIKSRVIVDVI